MQFRTAVGIRCKDGVVLGVEKLVISKMLEPGSNKRINTIDRHAGVVRKQFHYTIRFFFVVILHLDFRWIGC